MSHWKISFIQFVQLVTIGCVALTIEADIKLAHFNESIRAIETHQPSHNVLSSASGNHNWRIEPNRKPQIQHQFDRVVARQNRRNSSSSRKNPSRLRLEVVRRAIRNRELKYVKVGMIKKTMIAISNDYEEENQTRLNHGAEVAATYKQRFPRSVYLFGYSGVNRTGLEKNLNDLNTLISTKIPTDHSPLDALESMVDVHHLNDLKDLIIEKMISFRNNSDMLLPSNDTLQEIRRILIRDFNSTINASKLVGDVLDRAVFNARTLVANSTSGDIDLARAFVKNRTDILIDITCGIIKIILNSTNSTITSTPSSTAFSTPNSTTKLPSNITVSYSEPSPQTTDIGMTSQMTNQRKTTTEPLSTSTLAWLSSSTMILYLSSTSRPATTPSLSTSAAIETTDTTYQSTNATEFGTTSTRTVSDTRMVPEEVISVAGVVAGLINGIVNEKILTFVKIGEKIATHGGKDIVKCVFDSIHVMLSIIPLEEIESKNLDVEILNATFCAFGDQIRKYTHMEENKVMSNELIEGFLSGLIEIAKVDTALGNMLRSIQGVIIANLMSPLNVSRMAVQNDIWNNSAKHVNEILNRLKIVLDKVIQKSLSEKELTTSDVMNIYFEKGIKTTEEVAKQLYDQDIDKIIINKIYGCLINDHGKVKKRHLRIANVTDVRNYIRQFVTLCKTAFPLKTSVWDLIGQIAWRSEDIKKSVGEMLHGKNATLKEIAKINVKKAKNNQKLKELQKEIEKQFESRVAISTKTRANLTSVIDTIMEQVKHFKSKSHTQVGKDLTKTFPATMNHIAITITNAMIINITRKRIKRNIIVKSAVNNFVKRLFELLGRATTDTQIILQVFDGLLSEAYSRSSSLARPSLNTLQRAIPSASSGPMMGRNGAFKDLALDDGRSSQAMANALKNGLARMDAPARSLPKSKPSLWWIGVVVGGAVLLLIIILVIIVVMRKRRAPAEEYDGEELPMVSETMPRIKPSVSFMNVAETILPTESTQVSCEESSLNTSKFVPMTAPQSDSLTDDTISDEERNNNSAVEKASTKDRKKVKRSEKRNKQEQKRRKKNEAGQVAEVVLHVANMDAKYPVKIREIEPENKKETGKAKSDGKAHIIINIKTLRTTRTPKEKEAVGDVPKIKREPKAKSIIVEVHEAKSAGKREKSYERVEPEQEVKSDEKKNIEVPINDQVMVKPAEVMPYKESLPKSEVQNEEVSRWNKPLESVEQILRAKSILNSRLRPLQSKRKSKIENEMRPDNMYYDVKSQPKYETTKLPKTVIRARFEHEMKKGRGQSSMDTKDTDEPKYIQFGGSVKEGTPLNTQKTQLNKDINLHKPIENSQLKQITLVKSVTQARTARNVDTIPNGEVNGQEPIDDTTEAEFARLGVSELFYV